MLEISYAPLWETLKAKGMKKADLHAVVSKAAVIALRKDEPVSLNVLMKLCAALDAPIEAVVCFKKV